MTSLYRCNNCKTTFESDRPVCGACDIDPARDPRLAGLIHKLETIHYDPPHPNTKIEGRGKNVLACTGKPILGHRATGVASVVNCKACRETDAWKANYQGEPVPAEPIEVESPCA